VERFQSERVVSICLTSAWAGVLVEKFGGISHYQGEVLTDVKSRWFLDDLMPDRKMNEVAVGAEPEFSHDIAAMRAGGLNANPQGSGYLFVGPALRQVL
jgi:hypothetical protein